MIFDKINTCLGFLKLLIAKVFYGKRIKIEGLVKIKSNFKIFISKDSALEIKKGTRIRENFYLRCEKGAKIYIGKNCFINNNANIVSLNQIFLGDNVSIGPNVVIYDHDHDFKNNFKEFISEPIKIGNNVWIGANVTILKGVKIGDNCIIAANTLITKDVKSNTIVREKKEIIEKETIIRK